MKSPNIFSYIEQQEAEYQTQQVPLGDNWSWNMRDHLQLIYHLKNSQFYTGDNDWMRPFKNIMEPIIELANWTEDIEVKDILFFIEGKNKRAMSFLIKKYHDEVYVRENDLDEFIDEVTEQDNTYGGVIVQDVKKGAPETPSLLNIAFCDQSDVIGGPIGFKFHFSPDGLRKMTAKGWGEESNGATVSVEDLIVLAEQSKESVEDQIKATTPGKVVEVYIVRGTLPQHYLEDDDNMEDWEPQVQVVAFYKDEKGKKHGVTLYRKKEKDSSLRFFTASPVENRGLGRGVGEKMLHPQIWTNWLSIHKHNFYEAASKVPIMTDDEGFTGANKIQDMENLEIMKVSQGSIVQAIQTASPANVQMLNGAVNEWMEQAQFSGAAQDPLLGVEQVSGTTFKGQERSVAQGRGSHDRKRGKRAKFLEQIYREMIIPQMVREITKGKEFLATLTADELSWLREQLATNYANRKLSKKLLDFDGPLPTEEEKVILKNTFKEEFSKQGNQKLIKILKDEFKGVEIRMGINIANKQKNLADLSDKILSIFQFAFQNPAAFQQAMQIPALSKSFNDILEFGGLSQSDFLSLTQPPQQAPQETLAPEPLEIKQPANEPA